MSDITDSFQRPIVFGGVQLPAMGVSQADVTGLTPGPAGEGSPEARLVQVSRWALAARIKHGVPLSDLLSHCQTLALIEASLCSYEKADRASGSTPC